MDSCVDIYCLNKRHSKIISNFLDDLEDIIEECTLYPEDLAQFRYVIEDFIAFHNGLGVYALDGVMEYKSWYLSLPNNVYWATKGYFAALTLKKGDDLLFFQEKILSLILKTINSLDNSLIIQPWTERENKVNLN